MVQHLLDALPDRKVKSEKVELPPLKGKPAAIIPKPHQTMLTRICLIIRLSYSLSARSTERIWPSADGSSQTYRSTFTPSSSAARALYWKSAKFLQSVNAIATVRLGSSGPKNLKLAERKKYKDRDE